MTFLELEKECKKRRFLKYLKLFLIFFVIVLGIFVFRVLLSKSEKEKSKKVEKIVVKKIEKVKKVKAVKKEAKQPDEKLNLYIDLNVSEIAKKTQKKGKISKKAIEKTKEAKTQNGIILKSEVLPSYETCINLALKYYNNKDYENALKWAKNANLQNNKKPLSWIITAKSLYALGKKEKAVEILKIYYNYSKNKEVLKLLKEMSE